MSHFPQDDPVEWESKTVTSAVKTFFRNLPEPIMTYKLHFKFIAAASEHKFERKLVKFGPTTVGQK